MKRFLSVILASGMILQNIAFTYATDRSVGGDEVSTSSTPFDLEPTSDSAAVFTTDTQAVVIDLSDIEKLDRFEGYIDNELIVITGYKGTATEIIIPAIVTQSDKTYEVVKIEDEAFKNNTTITSVTIEEGVSEVGKSVFKGCSNLEKIVIPESVTSIGTYAFRAAIN